MSGQGLDEVSSASPGEIARYAHGLREPLGPDAVDHVLGVVAELEQVGQINDVAFRARTSAISGPSPSISNKVRVSDEGEHVADAARALDVLAPMGDFGTLLGECHYRRRAFRAVVCAMISFIS
jgi:hypothetical protein